MATPYKLKLEKLAISAAKFLNRFRNYNKKIYPPTFGVSTTITRLISYQTYPIKSALETFYLIKATREIFPLIKQPCLMIQSASDHIVEKKKSRRNLPEDRLSKKTEEIHQTRLPYFYFRY